MKKKYADERINKLIEKSFHYAFQDDEWKEGLRDIREWNILYRDIDKILEYVNNGRQGKLFVNSNMWYILQDTLIEILDLYDLQLVGETNQEEEVFPKFANYIKCRIEYIDDSSCLDVIIKANDSVASEEEDEKIFFYGLSLMDINELARTQQAVENEWKIVKILEVMEEL